MRDVPAARPRADIGRHECEVEQTSKPTRVCRQSLCLEALIGTPEGESA